MKCRYYAIDKHGDQIRKYTGEPYWHHLAEVASIASLAYPDNQLVTEISWLHDVIEDTNTSFDELKNEFGFRVADGVMLLSDITPHNEGNRAYRKKKYKEMLANCTDPIVHTIKVADLISNTSSIVLHDPEFAETYLKEKTELLAVLTLADPRLARIAKSMVDLSLFAIGNNRLQSHLAKVSKKTGR
jgi:GTP diphosphokinase / guanosine-3',5'-bis(diphosphate) 3'-diphosphatase